MLLPVKSYLWNDNLVGIEIEAWLNSNVVAMLHQLHLAWIHVLDIWKLKKRRRDKQKSSTLVQLTLLFDTLLTASLEKSWMIIKIADRFQARWMLWNVLRCLIAACLGNLKLFIKDVDGFFKCYCHINTIYEMIIWWE